MRMPAFAWPTREKRTRSHPRGRRMRPTLGSHRTMALTTGIRFGRNDVTALIGEGGMSGLYLARGTNLPGRRP
jgi:hypothetical protein